MKNFFFLLLPLLVFSACQDDDDDTTPRPESQWQLSAVLADPGDGSGTFETVDSDRQLNLLTDGTYSSNGNLCDFNADADEPTLGTYSLANATLSPDNCVTTGGTPFGLEVRGDTLEVRYLCVEACVHRYLRQ